MNRSVFGGAFVALLVVAAFVAYSALFTVHQTEQKLVLRLGEPIRVANAPGLNAKIPFIDSVIPVDNRILDLEMPAQEVIASDQKRLVVDAFARYKITDPLRFYQAVGTVEAANNRVATILNSALRRVLGESSFTQLVRDERPQLMARIREQVNREAHNFGLTVIDVRIRRADLPEQNSQAIFDRMKTERQREAAELRAQGGEAAQRIRSRADRDAQVILAEANRDGESTRGAGDGERNRIFAAAYGKDPDFFAFYRSMQAYEQSLRTDTRLVLSPNSEFFRYFGDENGRAPAPASSSAPPAALQPPAAAAPAP